MSDIEKNLERKMQRQLNESNTSFILGAKCIPSKKDPPGQKSFYILPGDHHSEVYRASTFKYFPNDEVDPLCLVINGFYYTGYKDRVKCFSCGMSVENWKHGDDDDFSRFHFSDCDYMNGRDSSNIPLGIRRLKNNSKQNIKPLSVPSAGQVLSNEIIHSNFQVNINQSTSSNQTRSSTSQITVNFQNNNQEIEINDEADIRNRMDHFPCLNAINPHMRNSQLRLQTFHERTENWPAQRINATFQQLSDAGFFYLGERDRVKCWYCNGGIQNWEREDDAWEEHAKWFPMCEYVLQRKGPRYVQNIVSRFPNLQRPPLYNPAQNAPYNIGNRTVRTPEVQQSPGPVIIDPRKKQEEQKRKIEEEMKSSDLVAKALMLGFEEKLIRKALKSQYELHDNSFSTFENLIEAILEIENNEENISEEHQETSTQTNTKLSAKEELKAMIDSKKCSVCKRKDSNIVFLPCGHLVCCDQCSKNLQKCPKCYSEITKKILSYIS